LTVGSETYTTASVAVGGSDAVTAESVKDALLIATGTSSGQTLAQDLGITVGRSGDNVTLTYADKENVADVTYTLAGAGTGTPSGSGTITDGENKARTAITAIDTALDTVAEERANLGALQSQLESTVRNLANVAENTAAAQGRIMDTDYAAETANLTKAQILQQAATSILAQANA